MGSLDVSHLAGCGCQGCSGQDYRSEDFVPQFVSLDPSAGGTYADKPIYDVDQINANLNRTGEDWYTNNYGVLNDGVLNYGFWDSIEELQNSYYVNDDGSLAFTEAFAADAFATFTGAQRAITREVIGLWDDLVDISFSETRSGVADITYGNTSARAGVQAYAYLPFGDVFDDYYEAFGWETAQVGRLGGDVWIGGNVASNFFPLEDSYYSVITLIHETGHALGLSHPGDYNASDDNDGDGVADPITYEGDAFYAQDSLQYTVMSYFDAYETGAQHIDWTLTNFAYSATPLVHDISSIQAIYGVDTTTRTGDTVYGFNSTADRTAYDFTQNTRPIVAIWDAGGVDTLDFSGWDTPSVIDLNEGAFSSGGGIEEFLTLEEVNANRALLGFAPRSQATFDFYEGLKAQLGLTNGLFTDNVSIAYGAIIENAVGGGGADIITGNAADNVLSGGAGIDTILGGAGNDTLIGGIGGDTLDGQGGIDTVSYVGSAARVTVNLSNNYTAGGDAFKDKISNFENITGSSFNDTLTGGNGSNTINGGDGDDVIAGSNGDDVLYGDGGADLLRGGNGNDLLEGGAGGDTLQGDNGNDVLNGGAGADILSGGFGNDRLVFTVSDGSKDRITDFRSGSDKIDLSGFDAIVGNANTNDHFTWLGTGALTGVAGQLHSFRDGGVFSLGGDTDGDGIADFIVNLSGVAAIAATDIIFA